tara:strand:- start:721 stop:1047 length:327 start_codon:yes stop_codon:yes gene_type:complete
MNTETKMPDAEMPQFPMYENPSNKLEENWVLMTVLHLTWEVANKLSVEEKTFLLERAKEVNNFMMMQQQQQQMMQQQMVQQQQQQAEEQDTVLPDVVPNGPEMVLNAD